MQGLGRVWTHNRRSGAARAGPRLVDAWRQVLARWFLRVRQRARLRRELEHMEDRVLRDIGVSRAALEKEAAKPFWRP